MRVLAAGQVAHYFQLAVQICICRLDLLLLARPDRPGRFVYKTHNSTRTDRPPTGTLDSAECACFAKSSCQAFTVVTEAPLDHLLLLLRGFGLLARA